MWRQTFYLYQPKTHQVAIKVAGFVIHMGGVGLK
jgi:hypothetical protein